MSVPQGDEPVDANLRAAAAKLKPGGRWDVVRVEDADGHLADRLREGWEPFAVVERGGLIWWCLRRFQ